MRILSATEAVSPAIARTKLILFKPFRLGRSWKFSATAYVSTMGTTYMPFPLLGLFFIPFVLHEEQKWLPWAIAGGVALVLALCTIIFMLCSRLQFPFMDVIMNRSIFIAPLWRQYGPQARRWAQAKMVIGTITMLAMAAPIGLIIWWEIHRLNSIQAFADAQHSPMPFVFFGIVLFVYSGLALVLLATSLLNDFMLPPLALEDAPVADAWRWVVQLLRAEPGQVALYALLKIVLGFAVQMACVIIFELVFILLMLVLGLVGALVVGLLHAMHVPYVIVQALEIIAIFVLEIGFVGYVMQFAYGLPMVFLEAYKLYFLGGRYPPLGDILDRTTPPVEPNIPAPNYLAYAAPTPAPPANFS